MSDILTKIEAYKREEIAAAKRAHPLASLEALAKAAPPPRGFVRAIRRKARRGDYALIAEVKKASPSKGLIRADFDPPALARAYRGRRRGVSFGADRYAVVPGPSRFHGGGTRGHRNCRCCARISSIDTYQVVEARAHGADCILIIMAALDDGAARDIEDAAIAHGMDVLVEIHDRAELESRLEASLADDRRQQPEPAHLRDHACHQ